MLAACARAASELTAARRLAKALDAEKRALTVRLAAAQDRAAKFEAQARSGLERAGKAETLAAVERAARLKVETEPVPPPTPAELPVTHAEALRLRIDLKAMEAEIAHLNDEAARLRTTSRCPKTRRRAPWLLSGAVGVAVGLAIGLLAARD